MEFEIRRTLVETYTVEAVSKEEALKSGFCDPIKITVIKETIKEIKPFNPMTDVY